MPNDKSSGEFGLIQCLNRITLDGVAQSVDLDREANALAILRNEYDRVEQAYEDQRRRVRRLMESCETDEIEAGGFKISKTDDRTIRQFDIELLKDELRIHFMSDGEIQRIIDNSKEFVERHGVIRMKRIANTSRG